MMTTPLVCLLLTPRSRLRADRIVVSIVSWVPLNRSRPPATTSSLLLSMRAVGRRSRSLTMMFRRTRVSASRTRLDCGNFRRIVPSSKNSFNCTRSTMVTRIEWTSSSSVDAGRLCVSAMFVRVCLSDTRLQTSCRPLRDGFRRRRRNWRAILDERICSARVWRTSWLTSAATFQL